MRAWLTQDSIPATRTEYVLTLPSSWEWRAQFLGAFLLLSKAENWEEFGLLTPDEMAAEWLELFLLFEEFGEFVMPVGTILEFAGASLPSGYLWADGAAVSRVDYADLFAAIGVAFGSGNGTTTFNLPDRRGRVGVGEDDTWPDFDSLGNVGGEIQHVLTVAEMPAHTHPQSSHNHTQDPHVHTQNSHNHTQNPHAHNRNVVPEGEIYIRSAAASGAFGFAGGTRGTATGTMTENATATNQAATATNQNAVATNQAATATNLDFGGDGEHENMPPFLILNYIIKF